MVGLQLPHALIPGVNIGVAPLVKMLVLPPVIVTLLAWCHRKMRGGNHAMADYPTTMAALLARAESGIGSRRLYPSDGG